VAIKKFITDREDQVRLVELPSHCPDETIIYNVKVERDACDCHFTMEMLTEAIIGLEFIDARLES
jgi:hypothetical protein